MKLTKPEVEQYLSRIRFKLYPRVNLEILKVLQSQHLLTVPFENLDVHLHHPITLDTSRFYDKIVNEKRGGFCYELNGLFSELLTALGFKTTLISGRGFSGADKYEEEFDHLAILTEVGDEKYITDVGFGEFSFAPLIFKNDVIQKDDRGIFKIEPFNDPYFVILKKGENETWNKTYLFSVAPRTLSDFEGMCTYHQNSPESHFTKKMVVSIPTAEGRITLTYDSLKITRGKYQTETEMSSPEDFERSLLRYFNIDLKNASAVKKA